MSIRHIFYSMNSLVNHVSGIKAGDTVIVMFLYSKEDILNRFPLLNNCNLLTIKNEKRVINELYEGIINENGKFLSYYD